MNNIKNKILSLTLTLALIMSAILPATTVFASEDSYTRTTITLKDLDSNSRIQNSNISIKNSSGAQMTFTLSSDGSYDYNASGSGQSLLTSNSYGKIVVDNLPVGTYTCVDENKTGSYISNGNPTFNLASISSNVEVAMDYEQNVGTLKVTLLDEDTNAPIEKSRFVLVNSSGNTLDITYNGSTYECTNSQSGAGEFITSSAGVATVEGVPVGTYTLKQIETLSTYNSELVSSTVTITAKQTTSKTVYNKKSYGDLSVSITNSSDSLVGGYEFKITNSSDKEMTFTKVSDNKYYYDESSTNTTLVMDTDASLVVMGISEGSGYKLTQTKGVDDYGDLTAQTFSIVNTKTTALKYSAEGKSGGISLAVSNEASQSVESVGFELYKDETIQYFKLSNGKYVLTEDSDDLSVILSDEDGLISVENAAVGDYSIKQVSSPDGYSVSEDTLDITVSAGLTTEETFVVKKTNAFLKFVGPKGESVEGLSISIFTEEGEQEATVLTNKSGYIYLDELVPGDYYYNITEVVSGYSVNNNNNNFSVMSDMTISTEEDTVVQNSQIEVTVTCDGDESLEGYYYTLTNADGDVFSAKSNSLGVALFENVPFGVYSVSTTVAENGKESISVLADVIIVDSTFDNEDGKIDVEITSEFLDSMTALSTESDDGGFKVSTVIGILFLIALIATAAYFAKPFMEKLKAEKEDTIVELEGSDEPVPSIVTSEEEVEETEDISIDDVIIPSDIEDRKPKTVDFKNDPFKK